VRQSSAAHGFSVRASFDETVLYVFSGNHASKARTGFKEHVFDWGTGASLLFESEGGGQAGDAAADDGDAFHAFILSWSRRDAGATLAARKRRRSCFSHS